MEFMCTKGRMRIIFFKWVDEVLLDKNRMVDGKRRRVAEDVIDLRKKVMDNMELHKEMLKKMEEEIVKSLIGSPATTCKRYICGR